MHLDFIPRLVLEPGNDVLDLLGPLARGHKDGIRSFCHDEILGTHRSHQAMTGMDVAALAVLGNDISRGGVAAGILFKRVPQGMPGADVAPVTVQANHGGLVRFLHDRVIHRDIGGTSKGLGIQVDEIKVLPAPLVGGPAGIQNVRVQTPDFLNVELCGKQEHAAVPQVVTAFQVRLRGLRIRLFHELFNLMHRLGSVFARCAEPDVPVTGFGMTRQHPERHQLLFSSLAGSGEGLCEIFQVLHEVIGRQDQQLGIGILLQSMQGRDGDGRGRVASLGLQDDGRVFQSGQSQLFGGHEAVLLIADHQQFIGMPQRLQALDGGLKQALALPKGDELFRIQLARKRPQACARPPG